MRVIKKQRSLLRPEQAYAGFRLKAYEFYLQHVGNHGVSGFEDWLRKQKVITRALNELREKCV